MTDYIVEAKSRHEIRKLAYLLRLKMGLENRLYFPIVEMLDIFAVIYSPKFCYEIVEDKVLPENIHANTDILTGHIQIKESVYNGACDGKGRDRMTIAHEIGHFLMLCQLGFKLDRNFSKKEYPSYRDPEWQAKCFAGELLIDSRLTQNLNPYEISEECGVSISAAFYQHDIMHKRQAA